VVRVIRVRLLADGISAAVVLNLLWGHGWGASVGQDRGEGGS
jgi:hypothetical protein